MKTWLSGDASKQLTRDGGAETAHELEVEIEQIRARLAANEAERTELEAALRDLGSRRSAKSATDRSARLSARLPLLSCWTPSCGWYRRLIASKFGGSRAVEARAAANPQRRHVLVPPRSVEADVWTTDRDVAGTGVASWLTPNLMSGLAGAWSG